MALDQHAIIKQIDDVLGKHDPNASAASAISKDLSMMLSAIQRLAPPGSTYANGAQGYEHLLSGGVVAMSIALEPVRGILEALKHDYQSGYLQSVTELVHADIFADFLDMAHHLLEQNYKDAAAVIAGSVLEAHLRKLCGKHGITIVKADGTSKSGDALNAELKAAGAYSMLDQKNVTAWQDLRNKAAHGKYDEYNKDQVSLMLQAVQEFASRNPA
jgi:hypothetical protein